jgi:hypothetical protein
VDVHALPRACLVIVQYQRIIKKKFGIKRFAFSVVSGSSLVVAHMMATEGLHGR